jgi:hypothetical protein
MNEETRDSIMMHKCIFVWATAVAALAATGCQEAHNIRMRFAAMVPGTSEQLVGVDAKHQVLLCDVRSQEILRVLGSPGCPVRELRVSAAGTYVTAADADGRCHVWDIASGRPLLSIAMSGAGKERGAVAVAPGERLLACGGAGFIELHSLPDGAMVRRIPDSHASMLYEAGPAEEFTKAMKDAKILSLDISRGGHRVLLGTDQGIFEIDYVQCAVVWQRRLGSNQGVTLVRYTPNGSDFVAGTESGALEYYVDHQPVMGLRPAVNGRPAAGSFTAIEFTRNGAYFVLLDEQGGLSVVRPKDQKVISSSAPGKLDTQGIALSADQRSAWIGSQGNVERFTRLALIEEVWLKPAELE